MGHGMHWAAYLERKMNKQAEKKPKAKKVKKADKKEPETEKEEEDESLGPKPTVYDTLPFQVYELCKQAPTLPAYLQEMYEEYRQRKEEERRSKRNWRRKEKSMRRKSWRKNKER